MRVRGQPAAARLLPIPPGLAPSAQAVLGVVVAGMLLWMTEAAPLMSPFIASMPAPGFSEIPPVSNVIPFPMRPM